MNTCGTCKYFGDEREVERRYYTDEDGHVRWHESKYRECGLLKHINGDAVVQQVAGVVDGSGYFAALCVTDEFGCNQWRAK